MGASVWKVTLAQIAHPERLHANGESGVRRGGAIRARAEAAATTRGWRRHLRGHLLQPNLLGAELTDGQLATNLSASRHPERGKNTETRPSFNQDKIFRSFFKKDLTSRSLQVRRVVVQRFILPDVALFAVLNICQQCRFHKGLGRDSRGAGSFSCISFLCLLNVY